MTKQEALKLMVVLQAAYPRQDLRKDTVEVYAKFLQDLDFRVAQKVIADHVRTSKWFPTIAEIRRAVAEKTHQIPHVGEALAIVKDAARRGDYSMIKQNPVLARAVDTVGWFNLQYSEYPDPLYRQLESTYERFREHAIRNLVETPRIGLDRERLRMLPWYAEDEEDEKAWQ